MTKKKLKVPSSHKAAKALAKAVGTGCLHCAMRRFIGCWLAENAKGLRNARAAAVNVMIIENSAKFFGEIVGALAEERHLERMLADCNEIVRKVAIEAAYPHGHPDLAKDRTVN